MTGHIERVSVPYSPKEMFSLVEDIESYPKFIKWVKALRKSRPRDEGATHHCVGEAVVGFKGFTERFSTTVAADRASSTIQARLIRGPFRKLENDWMFETDPNGGTKITFRIDYQFSNPILAAVAAANRDVAIRKIMEAFLAEAERRFGQIATSERCPETPTITGPKSVEPISNGPPVNDPPTES
ncbi:MAG: type II toxin-antitoxin system RatA family toxin [Pseudomonadota bacterium]